MVAAKYILAESINKPSTFKSVSHFVGRVLTILTSASKGDQIYIQRPFLHLASQDTPVRFTAPPSALLDASQVGNSIFFAYHPCPHSKVNVMGSAIVSLVHPITHSALCLAVCQDWIWNSLLEGLCQRVAQEGFALVSPSTHGWIHLLVMLGGEELGGVLGVVRTRRRSLGGRSKRIPCP